MRPLAYAALAAGTSLQPLGIECRALCPDATYRFVTAMASPQGQRA